MIEQEAIQKRQRYVAAWNETMIKIWCEKIRELKVIDTGQLLNSVVSLGVQADGRFFEVKITQQFLEYGLWQDYGTGKEVYRGNPGDIYPNEKGRHKNRQRKQWFSNKYFSSVMKMKDFLADSVGEQFVGVMSNAFRDEFMRHNHDLLSKLNL